MIGWIIGLSISSSGLYFAGGQGFKLARRLGCSLLLLASVCLLLGFSWSGWWVYLLLLIANYGALSTYHDYLVKDGSENWLCWTMTGFVYGLACLPLIWLGVHWYAILIRAVVLAIAIPLLRENTVKVEVEELGSGFLYLVTLPLIAI